jgi:hypothetical protein
MRLRLTGTSQEIAAVLPVLAAVLDVQETSEFYPNRGASVLGRVYLDITARGPAPCEPRPPAPTPTRRESTRDEAVNSHDHRERPGRGANIRWDR